MWPNPHGEIAMSLIATSVSLFHAAQAAYRQHVDARAVEALPFEVRKDIGWQQPAYQPSVIIGQGSLVPRNNMIADSRLA